MYPQHSNARGTICQEITSVYFENCILAAGHTLRQMSCWLITRVEHSIQVSVASMCSASEFGIRSGKGGFPWEALFVVWKYVCLDWQSLNSALQAFQLFDELIWLEN